MKTVIKNGQLLDNNEFKQVDIEIEGKIITKIGENLPIDGCEVIDAKGLLVTPGFIDLHVHLREPGGEHKETIETGTLLLQKVVLLQLLPCQIQNQFLIQLNI